MASSDRDRQLSQNPVGTHRFAEGRSQASPSSGTTGSTPLLDPGNPRLFVGLVSPVRSLVSGAVFKSVCIFLRKRGGGGEGEEVCVHVVRSGKEGRVGGGDMIPLERHERELQKGQLRVPGGDAKPQRPGRWRVCSPPKSSERVTVSYGQNKIRIILRGSSCLSSRRFRGSLEEMGGGAEFWPRGFPSGAGLVRV